MKNRVAPIVFLAIVSLVFLNFLRQPLTGVSLFFILIGIGAAIGAIRATLVYNQTDVSVSAIVSAALGAVGPFGLFSFSYLAIIIGIVTLLVKRSKATTGTYVFSLAGIGLGVIGVMVNLNQHGLLGQ